LLEDILPLCNADDKVVLDISDAHPYYASYEQVLHDMPFNHPLHKLQGETFHQLLATVAKNPVRTLLIGCGTKEDINTTENERIKSMHINIFLIY
jgi:hypothetical protein